MNSHHFTKLFLVPCLLLPLQLAVSISWASGKPALEDCRARIAPANICMNKKDASGEYPDYPTHDCDKDSKDIPQVVAKLQEVYDSLPKTHQRLFCSIPIIYAYVDPTDGTCTSQVYTDEKDSSKQMVYLQIGFKPEVLAGSDAKGANGNVSSDMDEQIAFAFFDTPPADMTLFPGHYFLGTQAKDQNNPVLLPGIKANGGSQQDVLHEMGHIFDFLNHVNPVAKGCTNSSLPSDMKTECVAAKGSWTELSWINQKESIFDRTFPDRSLFDGYFSGIDPNIPHATNPDVPAGRGEEMLKGLFTETSFVSSLGATQPFDDWAESTVRWALMTQYGLKQPVSFITKAGAIYNMTDFYYSKNEYAKAAPFAKKRAYLEKFFAREDLNYPAPTTLEQFFKDPNSKAASTKRRHKKHKKGQ